MTWYDEYSERARLVNGVKRTQEGKQKHFTSLNIDLLETRRKIARRHSILQMLSDNKRSKSYAIFC